MFFPNTNHTDCTNLARRYARADLPEENNYTLTLAIFIRGISEIRGLNILQVYICFFRTRIARIARIHASQAGVCLPDESSFVATITLTKTKTAFIRGIREIRGRNKDRLIVFNRVDKYCQREYTEFRRVYARASLCCLRMKTLISHRTHRNSQTFNFKFLSLGF